MSLRQSLLAGAAVVVADDHMDSAELLEMVLARAGAQVRTAGTAGAVLDLVATWKPDAFLLDITLPDMDGYALLEAIRQVPGCASTPAVAVTGHSFEQNRQRAAAGGFAAHVVKPFDREALLYVLEQVLQPASSEDTQVSSVRALRGILAEKGVHEALRFLNERTAHRFTGIYRFDGVMLRNDYLIDARAPEVRRGDDALAAGTYCSLVGAERRPFATHDALRDARLEGHPAREIIQSYCGALLRNQDGTPFGSLCHFDVVPCRIASDEVELLDLAAPWIAREVLLARRCTSTASDQ